MSDNVKILIQNLRGERDEFPGEYVREAADEIERLTTENERFRNALKNIVGMDDSHSNEYHVARRALEGEEEDNA